MAGLLELLSKSSGSTPSASTDPAAPIGTEGGFESAAAQVMDCLKNNDVPGFSEALRACIEMADQDTPLA